MGQMYGNINIYNDVAKVGKNVTNSYGGEAVPAPENSVSAKAGIEEILGYQFSRGEKISNADDSFDEFLRLRQQQAKAKEAGIDATETREEKEAQKEIARSITDEELKQLAMMGIDVEGAKLSDLMGIINTLRSEAHREQTAELMAKISLGNGDTDRLVVAGAAVKLAGSDIELDHVKAEDIASIEDNEESFTVSNDELVYLLNNKLAVTKENMYKAHFSGSKAVKECSSELLNKMMPQIEKVIAQTGYEVNDDTIEGADFLLSNELPVTTDNLRSYMEYQTLTGIPVDEIAYDKLTPDVNIVAEELYTKVQSIDTAAVYEMAAKGMEITISSAEKYGKNRGEYLPADDLKAVTSMRRMEEIRLSMTLEVSVKLIKSDINIDTRDLEQVVSRLKNIEQQMMERLLAREGVEPSKENVELYNEVNNKITALRTAPAEVIAAPLLKGSYSVNTIHAVWLEKQEANVAFASTQLGEKAIRSYEAVGTAPRADMGDSITKAFSNVDDILKEMNISVSYESQRAVRILGYNQLPITVDNIEQIISFDRQVNELMDSFYPEAVLGMIKDGINPLDVSLEELNETIRRRNYNEGVSEAENFATYLRDMEKQGQVSPEERASYVGIFRVMSKLAKSGDREAGWLFANGSRLTVRNLISAMRSRKAAGIDAAVDDEFGMLDGIDFEGNRMDVQIESAFAGVAQDSSRKLEEIKSGQQALEDEATIAFMEEHGIELTMINASAVYTMLNTEGGIYSLADKLLSKLSFNTRATENAIDEETENMTDSLMGEEIPVNFTPENILESLTDSDSMSLKYEDLRNELVEFMYAAGAVDNISGLDIATIKTVNAGFNILGRMAKEDRYQIPYRTEQGISVMNLTIRHGLSEKGNVQISMTNYVYGEMKAELRLNGNTLYGSIYAESSQGNYRLMEIEEEIKQSLSEAGFDGQNISVGHTGMTRDDNLSVEVEDYKGEHLYSVAVAAVKAMSLVK
ncbi:MAG: DUF6240 domain-containing protein [Wujia sp.]